MFEKKQERTKAKTAIKLAARRLISAANREADFDCLKGLMLELEKFYDDFLFVNEEFESLVTMEGNKEHSIVNGEDVLAYRENVKKSYMEAQEVFLKRRNEDKSKSMAVETVRTALKLEVMTLADIMNVAEENLYSESPNISALQLDMKELEELSSLLNGKTSELSLINSSKHEQDISLTEEIRNVLGRSRSQVRAIKLRLHECQRPDNTVHSPVSSASPLPQSISSNKSGNDPVTINAGTTGDTTVVNSGNVINVSAPSSAPTPLLTATSSHVFSDSMTSTESSLSSDNLIYTSGMTASPPSIMNQGRSYPQPIFTNPLLQSQSHLPTSFFPSTTTSLSYPSTPAHNPVSFPPMSVHYTQPLYGVQSTLAYPQTPNLQTSYHYPSTSPPTISLHASEPVHYTSNVYGHNPLPPSSVQLRKMELPTFNGRRRDWPEFKAIWKSVAESAYRNKTALAHELKRSVKGEASKRINSVYITKPEAYDMMWNKLESYYEDVGASVQAALDDLHRLKPVAEEDFRGLVDLVDEVESAYSQLSELGNLNILTMRDVDQITELLPNHLKVEWRRRYRDITPTEKVRPFVSFMKFLDTEREAVSRMAENQPRQRFKKTSHHADRHGSKKFYKCTFPSHRKDNINHTTEECKEFQKLPVGGKNGKYQLLKEINACFKCFGNHQRQNCQSKEQCNCDSNGHHKLLCEGKPKSDNPTGEEVKAEKRETHVAQSDSMSLYPSTKFL